MTYRIANVRFKEGERTYPVNCHRADIKAGDRVFVELPEQEDSIKRAKVVSVEYKNWDCKNSLVCLISELQPAEGGGWEVVHNYAHNGQIHNVNDLCARLRNLGWIPHTPRQSTWKVAYTLDRGAQTAWILLRKNGIDFRAPGRSVDHWYHDSGIDLFVFCLSFAESWAAQVGEYDEFFEQKGRRFAKPPRQRNELADIYSAFSDGSGGRAYVGDGIWIGSSGSTWDEGR